MPAKGNIYKYSFSNLPPKEYQREYAKFHKHKKAATDKAWRKLNPSRVKSYQNRWRLKNLEARRIESKKWRDSNPGWRRKYTLKEYGLDATQYQEIYIRQEGLCAVCGKSSKESGRGPREKHLHIDHCHKTKSVRGLLCYKCNLGIGNFCDDVGILKKAILYLNANLPS